MENASIYRYAVYSMPELVAHLLEQMSSEVVGCARVTVCVGGLLALMVTTYGARCTLEAHLRAIHEHWRVECWYGVGPEVDGTIMCVVGINALSPLQALMEP